MKKTILFLFACAVIASCSRKDADVKPVDYKKAYSGFWKGAFDDGGETGSLMLFFRDNGTLRFYNYNTTDTATANARIDMPYTLADNRFTAETNDGLLFAGQINKEGNVLTGEIKKSNYFYLTFVITKQQ